MEAVRALVDHQADVNAENEFKAKAIHFAAINGNCIIKTNWISKTWNPLWLKLT